MSKGDPRKSNRASFWMRDEVTEERGSGNKEGWYPRRSTEKNDSVYLRTTREYSL